MSKRAPSADAFRCAGRPSRRPRPAPARPTVSATSVGTGAGRLNASAISAATPPTSVARASVTRSAGPNAVGTGSRPGHGASAACVTTPQASPTTQPTPSRPTRRGERGEQRQLADQPDHRAGLNRTHRASVSMGYCGNTRNATVRFISGSGKGEAGVGRRARVLAARARHRRDPAGAAARARPGRRPRAHAALRHQPRHRDAGVPRRRPGEPVRSDAGAVPGRRLPGAGQVRLPQRRRRRARAAGTASAAPFSASTRTRPPTWCRRGR